MCGWKEECVGGYKNADNKIKWKEERKRHRNREIKKGGKKKIEKERKKEERERERENLDWMAFNLSHWNSIA